MPGESYLHCHWYLPSSSCPCCHGYQGAQSISSLSARKKRLLLKVVIVFAHATPIVMPHPLVFSTKEAERRYRYSGGTSANESESESESLVLNIMIVIMNLMSHDYRTSWRS